MGDGSIKQVAVISGPSGSGESAITNAILAQFPDRVRRLVTATTRAPRPGETYGVDYYFFSKEDFLAKQTAGEMLEVTHIENRDVYYGTYAPDLQSKLDAGFVVLANTDGVGISFYKKHYGATAIFIMPGDMTELLARLRTRNPEMSDEELAQRQQNALKEVAEDRPLCDFTVINADQQLAAAVANVVAILTREGYRLA